MKIFGPVPSRRLGQSLGVNNIPFKICSYSCIYCQLGRTNKLLFKRSKFYDPKLLYDEISNKIKQIEKENKEIDYITFVADGEPTLDLNLGKEIELIKTFGIKVAVITNSSTIYMKDVVNDLKKADFVSVKIDSVIESIWKKIDRPYGKLNLNKILRGIKEFRNYYNGILATETMLVNNINDNNENINGIAEFLRSINPDKVFITTPIRPPAEANVQKASNEILNKCFKAFINKVNCSVDCITSSEGEDFFVSNNIEQDILSILSVHPVMEEVLISLVNKKGCSKELINKIEKQNLIKTVFYNNTKYYIRSNWG